MDKVLGPETLIEAVAFFANYENCRAYMVNLRWPKGKVTCPTCGSDHVTYLEGARLWKCYAKHERPKFSLKTGTIFEDSPISLEKWLPVMWMVVNCKNGVSSWEIHRAIGVTQKTAWFMLQRCRLAMQDDLTGGSLDGEVEVDETFIGGKSRNMHKSKKVRLNAANEGRGLTGGVGKTIVMGILERGGKVRATIIPDRSKASIQPVIQGSVEKGATIISDEWAEKYRMDDEYEHQIVNHLAQYVDGNVHTNGMENFWSLLKRSIGGTYVSVAPFHLFRYVDEQAFRFNNRVMSDSLRFRLAMRYVVGRRLTYAELTGKTEGATCEEIPF
jgi:transposase-like protein